MSGWSVLLALWFSWKKKEKTEEKKIVCFLCPWTLCAVLSTSILLRLLLFVRILVNKKVSYKHKKIHNK